MTDTLQRALSDAEKEKFIKKSALIVELCAALKEYFIVEVCEQKGDIRLEFPNGQRFKIEVNEL